MIIDAFLYHDEQEIFDLRVEVLRDHVDAFLVVQGDRTHRGNSREMVQHYIPGHVCRNYIAGLPKEGSPEARENYHRNAIKTALALYKPNPSDIILISDVDEIPDPKTWPEMKRHTALNEIVAFRQIHSYYRLNLVDPEPWWGTRAMRWSVLSHPHVTPQNTRAVSHAKGQHEIEQGGWHFGWMGGNHRVRSKLESFFHEELDSDGLKSDAYLDYCVQKKVTGHNQHRLVDLGTSFLPDVVRANIDKYKNMLAL